MSTASGHYRLNSSKDCHPETNVAFVSGWAFACSLAIPVDFGKRDLMITPNAPIKRRKLSDDVQDRLLEIIRGPNFAPGDPLPSERELMRAYSVGRPAIREAMQNLARMGLIEIRHGERPKVAAPSLDKTIDQLGDTMRHLLRHSPADLAHLKEARVVFETQMVRIAAQKRQSDDISRLVQIVDQQEKSSSDSEVFLDRDGDFHRAIAEISGNPIFSSLNEAMFGWLAHFHIDLVRKPGLEKLTIKEHRDIIEAIADKDEERAAKAMTDHLNRANALYHQSHGLHPEQTG